MLLSSLLLKISRSGLWSTDTTNFVHPSVNIRECWRDHVTANASPSVGEYRLSEAFVKREPA